MKFHIQIITVAFLFSVLSIFKTSAQERTTLFAVEIDPTTYMLKGYSLHLRIKPAGCDKWMIGAGTYGLNLPDMLVNLNPKNKNEGWDVRINSAYALYGEYYFKEANQRWFIGEQVGVQNFKISNDTESSADQAKFRNILLMTYFGYSWHPGNGDFYIKPWAGLGYTHKVLGYTTVGNLYYDVAPIFPFVTLHLGYNF
jgi:hypothetical protein